MTDTTPRGILELLEHQYVSPRASSKPLLSETIVFQERNITLGVVSRYSRGEELI